MGTDDELCELTLMPPDQCGCTRHRGTPGPRPTTWHEHPPPEYDGPRPPKGAILVHKNGKAHWYGCGSLPDYEYLVPPTWGWIEDRRAWSRIGTHEIPATGGNDQLRAVRRCLECDT